MRGMNDIGVLFNSGGTDSQNSLSMLLDAILWKTMEKEEVKRCRRKFIEFN